MDDRTSESGERGTPALPERMPPEVVAMVVHELRWVQVAIDAPHDSRGQNWRRSREGVANVITLMEDYL